MTSHKLTSIKFISSAYDIKCLLDQWRRQDLLQEGTKMEIVMGTHGGLHGRVQQELDD